MPKKWIVISVVALIVLIGGVFLLFFAPTGKESGGLFGLFPSSSEDGAPSPVDEFSLGGQRTFESRGAPSQEGEVSPVESEAPDSQRGFFGRIADVVRGFFSREDTADTTSAPQDRGFFSFLGDDEGSFSAEETPDAGGLPPPQGGEIPSGPLQKLRQITTTPTAGAVYLSRTDGTNKIPFLRFLERATGYIYETDVSTMKEGRLTNTTLPGANEAFFNKTGDSIIIRYLDNEGVIETFAAEINVKEGGEGTLDGIFLSENISDISISPDTKNIFYLLPSQDGVSGITASFAGGRKAQIFSYPITEWLSYYTSRGILLAVKPSADIPGFVYTLSAGTGDITKLFGNVTGLTVLPSGDQSRVLYSQTARGRVLLNVFAERNKPALSVSPTTLPEKCAWAKDNIIVYCGMPISFPSASYPDAWYRGTVSFVDTIWKMNTVTGRGEELVNPVSFANVNLDVYKPFVSDDGLFFFFTNKNDMTVWALELK